MSGHSKWANIKHRKEKVDAQKAQIFSKLSRQIFVAARQGGTLPEANFQLRLAIEKAKKSGVPNPNIERALKKAEGGAEGEDFEEVVYEGYGPQGVAVMVETLTDNRNRTAGDIRSYFTKCNGNLGESGCVGWMFHSKGVIELEEESDFDGDALLLDSAEGGAEDVKEEEGVTKVITPPERLEEVLRFLLEKSYPIKSSSLERIPEVEVKVDDPKVVKQLLRLMDLLENHEDVQKVYANFDIPDGLIDL